MNRISTALAVAAFAVVTAFPAAAQDEKLLEQAIKATDWQSANFRHVFRLHGTDQQVVESGKVVFGDLPQMRWQYTSPEEKVFVFDGRTSWLYVPAERQVSVHELTDSERSQLPFLLLENAETARRDFDLGSSRKGGAIQLSLTPKNNAQIRSMVLSLDPESKRIRALEYADVEGNVTRFEFEGFRKTAKDPAQFRFDAPAGVESVEY
jgi:outer membrane lipoprotein carrier protein